MSSVYRKKAVFTLLAAILTLMLCGTGLPLFAQTKAASEPAFDINKALLHIKHLSVKIGARIAGSANEHASAVYIKKELDALGYATSLQTFKLPNKKLSHNIVATLRATGKSGGNSSARVIILGAHYDSKGGPGANDNASGVGVLLELARIATKQPNRPDALRLVFFGSEERIGAKPNDHHFGSRYYVNHMSAADKKATREMICVDMVGSGSTFTVRSLKKLPDSLSKRIIGEAKTLKMPAIYKQAGDESDFEAFERAGLKSTWLEWRIDNNWHTPRDTYDRLNKKDMTSTGVLLQKHLFTPLSL